MNFHLERPKINKRNYHCEGNEITTTNTYSNLGITYRPSGTFNANAQNLNAKSTKVTGGIRNTQVKTQAFSWDCIEGLFDASVLPTLIYAAEAWAYTQCDTVEEGQLNYYKSILGWQKIPQIISYVAKLVKLESIILKESLAW